jgi:hypothetical protein
MAVTTDVKVRHEEFCLPRPGSDAPRVEQFAAMSDDPKTGKSTATHTVTRCLECGAATYRERN